MTKSRTEAETPRVRLGNALIVVDVQNDFCPGGALAVDSGDKIASRIHQFVSLHGEDYKLVVATKDWHPSLADEPNFAHFSTTPDFVETWPVHCVHHTEGAAFHPNLNATAKNAVSDREAGWPPRSGQIEFDLVFYKGQHAAAYSGFEGNSMPSRSYDPPLGWSLHLYLKDKGIGHVDIVGLATDYCVKATALDAVRFGYDTSVLLDMVAGVADGTTEKAFSELVAAHVHLDPSSHDF